MRPALALLALGLASLLPVASAQANPSLQPFQMVRSLALVQDRIANGDHAALPMQRKLLEMSDERLRSATAEDFADPRNVSALLIYAMSGGNPVTVALAFSKLDAEHPAKPLADAIGSYVGGDFVTAQERLDAFEPREIGAHAPFLALVRGTVRSNGRPEAALADFETARLLAPGTLIEEAALRRSLVISVSIGDAETFTRSASAYVRRFLRSPYASQFAETFVSGMATLYADLDASEMADILSWMSSEQAENIALRMSRQAAISNDAAMIAFAADISGDAPADDPRALLYSNLGSIASPNVAETLSTLRSIDRTRLSEGDRALLDAATGVARRVVEPPSEAVTAASAGSPMQEDAETYINATRAKLEVIDRLLEGAQ
jgi:chemotaxis protein MotC